MSAGELDRSRIRLSEMLGPSCLTCGVPEYDTWSEPTHVRSDDGRWYVTYSFLGPNGSEEIPGHPFASTAEERRLSPPGPSPSWRARR